MLNAILVSFCLGLILNLFEEVEFFKNSEESLFLPVILTLSYIPNLIFINLMPFIIFISAMWFFISIKHNNELINTKSFWIFKRKNNFFDKYIIFFLGFINFNSY